MRRRERSSESVLWNHSILVAIVTNRVGQSFCRPEPRRAVPLRVNSPNSSHITKPHLKDHPLCISSYHLGKRGLKHLQAMAELWSRYRQISIGQSLHAKELVAAEEAGQAMRLFDLTLMQTSLLSSCFKWPFDTHCKGCPYPIVVSESRLHDLETLHTLLTIAITNIVERWWTDADARFPQRMPLEEYEEDLLKVCCDRVFRSEWKVLTGVVDGEPERERCS